MHGVDMNINMKHEPTYSFICQVDKLEFVQHVLQVSSEEGRNAELALYRRCPDEAESILLQASPPLIYRAIKLNVMTRPPFPVSVLLSRDTTPMHAASSQAQTSPPPKEVLVFARRGDSGFLFLCRATRCIVAHKSLVRACVSKACVRFSCSTFRSLRKPGMMCSLLPRSVLTSTSCKQLPFISRKSGFVCRLSSLFGPSSFPFRRSPQLNTVQKTVEPISPARAIAPCGRSAFLRTRHPKTATAIFGNHSNERER